MMTMSLIDAFGFLTDEQPSQDEIWERAFFQDWVNESRGFRKDKFGNWIHKDHYGNHQSPYGWELSPNSLKDFLIGAFLKGSDYNGAEPIQWEMNRQANETLFNQPLLQAYSFRCF